MIGLSIMMWFISIILLCVSIALFRGNTSIVHGKVFDESEDKVSYAKEMGWPCLLIVMGTVASGILAVVIKGDEAIMYSIIALVVVIALAVIWFIHIQKKYRRTK